MATLLSSLGSPYRGQMDETSDRELIYVGDPMCSWCWGIAPQLDELKQAHPELPLRLVVGGLRAGAAAEPMTESLAAFLAHHWRDVQARSSQPFDLSILERRDWVYDTEPACRAVVTMRMVDERLSWPLFKRLQRAFYAEGTLISDPAVYPYLVEEVGGDPARFMQSFGDEQTRKATWQDFAIAAGWGIRGFPTVLVRTGNTAYVIASGYARVSEMERALGSVLATP